MARLLKKISPYWASNVKSEELKEAQEDGNQEYHEFLQQNLQRYNEVTQKLNALPHEERLRLLSYQQAIDILVLPMMTMLMRSIENIKTFHRSAELINLLNAPIAQESDFYYPKQLYYLIEVIPLFYGEFIVILPESHTGFVAKAHGIRNVFHAITLLQDLMASNSSELQIGKINPDLKEVRSCRETRYNWYSAMAYENAELKNPMALAWGELPLGVLSKKQKQIILYAQEAKELTPRRSWDESFTALLHGEQNPHIDYVRTLTSTEVDSYLC